MAFWSVKTTGSRAGSVGCPAGHVAVVLRLKQQTHDCLHSPHLCCAAYELVITAVAEHAPLPARQAGTPLGLPAALTSALLLAAADLRHGWSAQAWETAACLH